VVPAVPTLFRLFQVPAVPDEYGAEVEFAELPEPDVFIELVDEVPVEPGCAEADPVVPVEPLVVPVPVVDPVEASVPVLLPVVPCELVPVVKAEVEPGSVVLPVAVVEPFVPAPFVLVVLRWVLQLASIIANGNTSITFFIIIVFFEAITIIMPATEQQSLPGGQSYLGFYDPHSIN
jgi:hypothetical protein